MSIALLDLDALHAIREPHRLGHASANFPGLPEGPGKLAFGALRLCAYETFAPGFPGFEMHPHDNVEVVTLVTAGRWAHRDSLGREGVLEAGDVQIMSAGSGLEHEERPEGPGAGVQLWFDPTERDTPPRIETAHRPAGAGGWVDLVGGETGLPIRADAVVRRARVPAGGSLPVTVAPDRGCLLLVVAGETSLEGKRATIGERHAVEGPFSGSLVAFADADVVAIDVVL